MLPIEEAIYIDKEEKNRRLLFALLKAQNEKDVTSTLEGPLGKGLKWKHYGGYTRNYSTIHNQQTNSVAALVEKVTNSIDAILMRECLKRGIDAKGPDAPQSPEAAVEQFFGITSDLILNNTAKERREIAKNLAVIASGDRRTPCITVVDNGEGQHPECFVDTLLSLHFGTSNKDEIFFVQGRFNMGGTGALRFCGKEKYQLVVSRRCPQLLESNQEDRIGFTLVRKHRATEGDLSSWYEYFVLNDESIPHIAPETINLLPEGMTGIEPYEYGTIIKMFNYGLKNPSNATLDLRRDISRFLFYPAIPFLVFEGRDYQDIERAGRSRTILGNRFQAIETEFIEDRMPLPFEADLGPLGKRRFEVIVFKKDLHRGEFIEKDQAVFFTIHGQTHGTLPQSWIRSKEGPRFHQLSKYMMVHIDCSDIRADTREEIFFPSRDRMVESSDVDDIKTILGRELRESEVLQALENERFREEASVAPRQSIVNVMKKLLGKNERLAKLIHLFPGIPIASKDKGQDKQRFVGKEFPTYLRIKGWNEDKGIYEKGIPVNKYGRILLETDACDNYLTRSHEPGKFGYEPEEMIRSWHLGGGLIAMKIIPRAGMLPGDIQTVRLWLTRPYDEPLEVFLRLRADKPEEDVDRPPVGKPNKKKKEQKSEEKNMPSFTLVYKDVPEGEEDSRTWQDMDPPFTEKDVAKITVLSSPSTNQDEEYAEILNVCINMDSSSLISFVRGLGPKQMDVAKNLYISYVYLFSLTYWSILDNDQREELLPRLIENVPDIVMNVTWNKDIFED